MKSAAGGAGVKNPGATIKFFFEKKRRNRCKFSCSSAIQNTCVAALADIGIGFASRRANSWLFPFASIALLMCFRLPAATSCMFQNFECTIHTGCSHCSRFCSEFIRRFSLNLRAFRLSAVCVLIRLTILWFAPRVSKSN